MGMTMYHEGRWHRWRHGVRRRPAVHVAYRSVVAVIGTAILLVGVIAIPYPGPGWACVFVGLTILASEFDWAKRVLARVRHRYQAVMAWFRGQARWVQASGTLLTAAVVLTTMWLLGVAHWTTSLVGLEWGWLASPI